MAKKKQKSKKNKNSGNTVRNRGKNFKNSKEMYSRSNSVDAFNTSEVLENPDPVWKQSRTNQQNYSDILWDPHLEAVISSRKSVTLSKEWLIEQGEASENVTKFIEEAFTRFDVHRSTEEILDSRSYGMQPMKPTWARPEDFEGEGKIFVTEFIGVPPYWFQYDNENKLRFRAVDNPWPGQEIEPYSLINPRNNAKYDNPYGEALLSKVYWHVNFKKAGFKFWVEGAEKYGNPFLWGKTARNSSGTETDEFSEKLVEMSKGSVMVTTDKEGLEVLDTKSKSSTDIYKALIDSANAEISKAYLGGTLTIESGDKGARSLGDVHNSVREDLAESDEILVEDCYNQLIRWLIDINFGPNEVAPTLVFQHEEDIKGDVAERDSKLKEQGVKLLEPYYKKTYNFEDGDFEMVEVETGDDKEGDDKEDSGGEKEFAESVNLPPSVEATHKFLDSLTEKDFAEQAEFIEPILKLVHGANSYSEIDKKLLTLFDKVRPVNLEKELGKAMLGAELISRGADD